MSGFMKDIAFAATLLLLRPIRRRFHVVRSEAAVL
jgi:hypothetical protein